MREILGRRRRLLFRLGFPLGRSRRGRTTGRRPGQLGAALTYATQWQWPVLPGVGLRPLGAAAGLGIGRRGRRAVCACPDPECVVPGAHPFDPGLLAASTDERMVRWWWANRPEAPVVLATGGQAPCAVSLPAEAASRALAALDATGMRLGPVVATPTRWSLLVAPYSLERLGELLHAKDWVPSSLRFHGEGGYLLLPSSAAGTAQAYWERAPLPGSATPWLPDVEAVVDALVEASTSAPDGGSRLAY
jgi:hypothetical protein